MSSVCITVVCRTNSLRFSAALAWVPTAEIHQSPDYFRPSFLCLSFSVICLFYFNKQRSHRAVKILAIDCHLTWHKLKCKKTSDHNHVSRGSSHPERLLGSEREDRVRYHQCLRCEGPRYQGRTLIKSRERLRNPFVSVYFIIINRMTILTAQWAEKKWIYSQFRWRRILCISREQGLRTKSCTR